MRLVMIAILKDRVPVVWIRYDWMTSQSVAHSTTPAKVTYLDALNPLLLNFGFKTHHSHWIQWYS